LVIRKLLTAPAGFSTMSEDRRALLAVAVLFSACATAPAIHRETPIAPLLIA
jgi:hypothetical protein